MNKMQYIQNGQFLSFWKYYTKEKPLKFYFSRNCHQGIWKFNLHQLDNALNICHYKTIFQAYAIMFMVLSDNLWLIMPMAGLVPATSWNLLRSAYCLVFNLGLGTNSDTWYKLMTLLKRIVRGRSIINNTGTFMGSDFWGRGRKPRPKQFVASKILRKLQQWHDGKERRNSKRIEVHICSCHWPKLIFGTSCKVDHSSKFYIGWNGLNFRVLMEPC